MKKATVFLGVVLLCFFLGIAWNDFLYTGTSNKFCGYYHFPIEDGSFRNLPWRQEIKN